MIDISQAILGLDEKAEFVINGSPSNEAEYQAQAELQADYDAKQYQRDRAAEYPELGEQLDKLYHDINNGTLTTSGGFFTALNAVKTKYPKE